MLISPAKLNKKLFLISLALFFYLFSATAFAAKAPAVKKTPAKKNTAPKLGIITPNSGKSQAEQSATFSTSYSDKDGWSDIQEADFLINTSSTGSKCFYGYYNVSNNALYLKDDAGANWLGGFTPGLANIIENSYAKLDCSKSTVSSTGTNLTVNWAITFKSNFASANKKMFLYVKDKTGAHTGWNNKGKWTVTTPVGNKPPSIGTLTPIVGTSKPNKLVGFTTTYVDPDGYKDITEAHILINTEASGNNCFYAYYNQGEKKLYLRDDGGAGWLVGFAPGSKNIIENTFAKLDCSKTIVSGTKQTLRIKWGVYFKENFFGGKFIYLYAKDKTGAETGWQRKGVRVIISSKPNPVPIQNPTINSLIPADNSTFLAGASINIQISASNPDNDTLQYQFTVGGTIRQAWSSANSYLWQTFSADTGAVSVLCEVKNTKGGAASKTISYSIINPTVEQILQKVADNYAKINDFKADMIFSSTLDGKSFGETEYCRYYFKAPNIEKTETFSDQYRNKKTDIIIINGSTMNLVDPAKNTNQQVDLLNDANINATQFNQTNIYYNQTLFLSQHLVMRNDLNSNLNNMLIVLEATPNSTNNIYDKLNLLIDYPKGIIAKFSIYKKNITGQMELIQETETIESRQMANGAWLPVKMNKNPNLTAGNLISTLTYENLTANIGLTDLDFDPTKQ